MTIVSFAAADRVSGAAGDARRAGSTVIAQHHAGHAERGIVLRLRVTGAMRGVRVRWWRGGTEPAARATRGA